jgi:hypothetical protein
MIVIVGLSSTVFSQNTNLNDYSYIIVPTKFDFLQEEDQFQINSMTKFYLNKYGFNAFFNTEVPNNVPRCDGLWAQVVKSSGLIYTKLEVVIKDCKGNEIFRSNQGKSKYKYYKKAYQDALRKAFISFQTLNVRQPEINVYQEEKMTDKPVLKEVGSKEINDIQVKEVVIVSEIGSYNGNLPETAFSTYTNNQSFYLLRKDNDGYAFYEETNKEDLILMGSISINGNALIYKDIKGNSYDVEIDKFGNISIYIDGNPTVYRLLD